MKNSKTNAKIIISGEHSVVYGNLAIAIPFKKLTTKTKILSSRDYYFFVNRKKYLFKNIVYKYEGYRRLIEYFVDKFNIKLPFIVSVKTNIPYENGLGHSASIAVSISKALIDYHKVPYSDDLLMELSSVSESFYHQNPSGIDQMVLIKNTNILYQNKKVIKFLNKMNKGYLLITNTQIESSTSNMVKYINKNKRLFNNIISNINDITEVIKIAWLNRDLPTIGKLLHENQLLLSKLDLSNEFIDDLINKTYELGSLGSKITGKGQGGAIIALYKNKKTAKRAMRKLKREGYRQTWIIKL